MKQNKIEFRKTERSPEWVCRNENFEFVDVDGFHCFISYGPISCTNGFDAVINIRDRGMLNHVIQYLSYGAFSDTYVISNIDDLMRHSLDDVFNLLKAAVSSDSSIIMYYRDDEIFEDINELYMEVLSQ